MDKETKKALRNNTLICFLYYVYNFKISWPITYKRDLSNIKSGKVPQSKRLKALKGIHKGESCIIVGNGPSAKFSDFDKIEASGIESFGANKIVDVLDKTTWRPKNLCIMDPSFIINASGNTDFSRYIDKINKYGIKNLFFTYLLNDEYKKNKAKLKGVNYYSVFSPLSILFSTDIMPFSDDISKYVADLGNVTPYQIQIAAYMGFKTIYLYGMDNTYSKYLDNDGKFKVNTMQSHMQGMSKDTSDSIVEKVPKTKFEAYKISGFADKRKSDMGYEACKKYCDEHGIKVINLTHGGKLDVFERGDFDQVFSN